ncbi:hypothetical protein [Methylomonas sp. AM2-LC]|uniref:hypothetical protein n=1 Tax=Methylomonas sp. AM2-LC TaxID=3153301 RepID=UPI003266F6AB
MDESKFQKLLTERGVVIVHFSHFAVMGHYVEFPDDLEHAIAFYQSETRSCCAFWPRHNMNLPGSVGVIFRPRFEQVLSVRADDSGSSDFGGAENSGGHAPSEQTILESLNVTAGRYNEWRVRGAEPVGIFVANTNDIYAKRKTQLSHNGETFEEIGYTNIAISSVFEAFPEMPIFTMRAGELFCIRDNAAKIY